MTHPPEAAADADVVRFHTRGVRFPRLIGKTADGTRLPGGPYTITQVVATVTVFIVGQWTRPAWGGNGLATDYLILAAAAVVIGFVLRHTSFGPRDPVTTAIAVVTLYLTPRTGRRDGRALRAIRPARAPRRATAPPRWLLPASAEQAGVAAPPAAVAAGSTAAMVSTAAMGSTAASKTPSRTPLVTADA